MVEIEHLKAMANDALAQYASETFAGGEPVYPQWAEEMLKVCDQAACYQWLKNNAKAGYIDFGDWSFDASDMVRLDRAIHDSMQRKI